MAQAPTAPNSGAAIQRLLSLQAEVAQSVGKDTETCIQKINDLKTIILAEYSALVEGENRRESARTIAQRLQAALVENGLPRPEKPKIEIQHLFERAHAMECANSFQRIEQKKRVESCAQYAIKAARNDAELCQAHTQDLVALGTQIAQARDSLSVPEASVNSGDRAAARQRRIEIYRAENFANNPAVLRLAIYSKQIRELVLAPDPALSEEQRALRIACLRQEMAADERHVPGQLALVGDQIRSILDRYDAFATFKNDCIVDSWIINTSKDIPLKLFDLCTQERLLQQLIQRGNSADAMVEIKRLRGEYEQVKAVAAQPPQYPNLDQFFTYGDSLAYPTSIKPAPEFDNLKKEAVTKELQSAWALIKAGIDLLCCNILDVRINYLTALLAQQADNAELAQMLQKDLEERLKFFMVEIAGTPSKAAEINKMFDKAEVLKKGVVATKAPALAENFNNAMMKLHAKQAEWLTADFAVKYRAKAGELKSGIDALKVLVDASWNPEIEKATLSEAEVNTLRGKLEGIDNPNSFEKQFGILVNMKYLTIDVLSTPFSDNENGWLKEIASRCVETPTLNRKIADQQYASKRAFDDQHGKLKQELSTHSQTVNDGLAFTLDKVKEKVREKTGAFQRAYSTIGTYTTRYRQWWNKGPEHAPKPATASAPASPPSASPENSVAVAAAPSASEGPAPGSPEKKE